MVSFSISISYVSPVRLSVIDSESFAVATPPPFSLCVCSSAMAPSLLASSPKGSLPGTLRKGNREQEQRRRARALVREDAWLRVDARALRCDGRLRGVRAAAWWARVARARPVTVRVDRPPVALLGLSLGR